jgi:hypothetical protein
MRTEPSLEEGLAWRLVFAYERDPRLDHLDGHLEQVIGAFRLCLGLFPGLACQRRRAV